MDEGGESGARPLRPEARLGAALRAAREKRGISLRALARRLYRAHSTLVEYERGHRLAPLDAVQAYERELGLVVGTLAILHQEAHLELDDEDPLRRPPAGHPSHQEPLRRRTAMESVSGRPMEPGLQDLGVLLPELSWWEILKLSPEQLRQLLPPPPLGGQPAPPPSPAEPPQQLSPQDVAA